MSEKVKVTQVTVKGQYGPEKKDFYTVFLEDLRTGTCFDSRIKDFIDKEVELDIKENDYKGEKQLNFYFPKKGGGRNYDFERKKVALSCAVGLASMGKIDLNEIPKYADNFQKYLQ